MKRNEKENLIENSYTMGAISYFGIQVSPDCGLSLTYGDAKHNSNLLSPVLSMSLVSTTLLVLAPAVTNVTASTFGE